MISQYVESFFNWFEVDEKRQNELISQVQNLKMPFHTHDLKAILAVLEVFKPQKILLMGFEHQNYVPILDIMAPDAKVYSLQAEHTGAELIEEIDPQTIIKNYGHMDFIMIDGFWQKNDIEENTRLSMKLRSENSLLCWYGVNKFTKSNNVYNYLNSQLALPILSTFDEESKGVACWSYEIEKKLSMTIYA